MATDALGPTEPSGNIEGLDPLADEHAADALALGYEAADPALLAQLWGEPVPELRA